VKPPREIERATTEGIEQPAGFAAERYLHMPSVPRSFQILLKSFSPLTPAQPIENPDLASDRNLWLSQPPRSGGACLGGRL
jgi:hypothetical protein